MNLKSILTGWGRAMNILEVPEDVQELSRKRLEACGSCTAARESKALEFLAGSAEHLDIVYCTVCKCPCHQKSLSEAEKCPLDKWKFD